MTLDPQVQEFLTAVESMGMPPFETFSVEEGRQVMGTFGMFMVEEEDVASVVDRTIPGPGGDIPVTIYTPEGPGPFPVTLYFHGGGFVVGSKELVAPVCRALANRAGCIVVAVGYRLAPEHPYPAAPDDAYAATAWVAAHGAEIGADGSRIAVMGDSAGGNLSTVTCLKAKEQGGPAIALQLLIYPATDFTDKDSPSYRENGEGYVLTAGMIEWFESHYFGSCPERKSEPSCSPAKAADLSGLPPAIIVTAEYDPIRDQGEAYGALLEKAGVPVDLRREAGMIHGFFWIGAAVARGATILDDFGADLRKALKA